MTGSPPRRVVALAWGAGVLVTLLACAAIVASVPAWRGRALRAFGHALVCADALHPADVIVVATDAGGAGVLEAIDLVESRVATRIALFADPPDAADREFIRRGARYYDAAAFEEAQLHALGIANVERIDRSVSGTEDEGRFLPDWARRRAYHSVILVTGADHSCRMRRVMARATGGSEVEVVVRASRYSPFDPDRWWMSRGGLRSGIIELQKLLWDRLRHPW